MVRRESFDQALVQAAVDAGAQFRDGVQVPGIEERDGRAILDVRSDQDRGQSGGRRGRLGRAMRTLRGGPQRAGGSGMEYELAMPRRQDGDPDGHPGRGHGRKQARGWQDARIDWGPTAGSYAWVFPKGDRLAVGVIQPRGNPGRSKACLACWLHQLGLERAEVLAYSGHLTQWRTDDSPLARGCVLVAGDAAPVGTASGTGARPARLHRMRLADLPGCVHRAVRVLPDCRWCPDRPGAEDPRLLAPVLAPPLPERRARRSRDVLAGNVVGRAPPS